MSRGGAVPGVPLALRGDSSYHAKGIRIGRVLMLIPVIWLLNLTDLGFTLLASTDRSFVELNPFAVHMSAHGLIVFKTAALVFFTVVFVVSHRRRTAEWACYILLGVYGLLAIFWFTMYGFVLSHYHLERLAVSL
jgi:hypothetical protein